MNYDKIIKQITKNIEKYKNKENKTWGEVYHSEIDKLTELTKKEKEYILMKVVKEISYHGYSIEDNPFKLIKF